MRDWHFTTELAGIPVAVGVLIILLAVIGGIWVGPWLAAVVTVGFALAAIAGLAAWFTRSSHPAPADAPDVSPIPDDRHRVLVVADTRGPASELLEALRSRAAGRPLSVLVIAPTLETRIGRLASDQNGYESAAQGLSDLLGVLRAGGIQARAEIGADDPLQAADDGLRQFPADEILFVADRETQTNWLEGGVVERAGSRYYQPVEHLTVS